MLHNIRSFKLARIYDKDLNDVAKHVQSSIDLLAPYIRYKPVARILSTLQTELGLIKAYQTDCKKILDNKGQVKEEDAQG